MLVQWNAAYPTQIGGIWIKPGVNEVPDALKGSREIRHFQNRGMLTITPPEGEAAAEATPLDKDLAGIRATFDLKVLKKLAKVDDRPEIQAAIEIQVAEIQRLKDEGKAAENSGAHGQDARVTVEQGQ